MSKLRPTLSYSNVIATIALFLALTGTAWAALAKNSVKSRNIAPGAVTSTKIGKDAVTSRKIGRRAVTARAIAPKAILPGAIGIGSVTSTALGTNSVIAAKIQNGNVTGPKIQASAVTTGKIAAKSITTGLLADTFVAPNSKLFDGLTSVKYMKTDRFGRTKVNGGTTAAAATTQGVATFIANTGAVDFTCDVDETFTLRNTGTAPMTVWTQADGGKANADTVAPSGTLPITSDSAVADGAGWIDWQISTGTTLIRMTTTAQAGPPCSYTAYYEETTLGAPQ